MKRNKKFKFNIDIIKIKEENSEKLEKKANDIKNKDLTHTQKIISILKEERDTTIVENNIKEENESRVEEISKAIKENDLDDPEKKELKLFQENDCNINTSPNLENEKKLCTTGDVNKENANDSKKINNNTENKDRNQEKQNETSYLDYTNNTTINASNINDSSLNFDSKGNDNSETSFCNNSNPNILIMPENINKEFNNVRSNYYIKYKFNDISLNQNINKITPERYKINEQIYAYLYPNDLNTYNITESCFLKKDNKDINIDNKEEEIDERYGLFFCGKEIVLEDGIHTKKCMPNEFMCKQCMEKNKNKYNIKNKYLININGRVAKINKGKYHCFGHFSVDNQIEDCVTSFSCNACKMLDSLSKYYN